MKLHRYHKPHRQNVLLPCIVFSGLVGLLTGAIVFAFRVISEQVIHWSHFFFDLAHEKPGFIPLLLLGALLVALFVSLCLTYSPHSRGGGIPTAVALIRGLITFHWLRNIIFVFTSALFSYLAGIPLGNDEGPAVQMGTAVGSGVTHTLARKHLAWERYLMTGGATAGFATATCAPISAVLFGLEEAHNRFSPLLILSSVSSVLSGMGMLRLLCALTGKSPLLFHFKLTAKLPLRLIWVVIPVALLCGIFSYLFASLAHHVRHTMHKHFKHVHPFFKVAPVFLAVVLIGSLFYESIGTGHHLIEEILEHHVVWYTALALLVIRAILVVFSNDVGATGGLFTPLLVFGALIGSVCADAMIAMGVLDSRYFMLLVVVGMTCFFAASVRTPLTAMVFAIEVFSGVHNVLPLFGAVLLAYVLVEFIGVEPINEIAMEREIHNENKDKVPHVVDVYATALEGSFAVGKSPRDILWPATCTVLTMHATEENPHSYEGGLIKEGDVLRLHFLTYDAARTEKELWAILGEQPIYDEDLIRYEPYET
jgi:H+/Cl- antiporter ClcA